MAHLVPEVLLHWIWRKRLYTPQALRTAEGEPVQVLSPGEPNPAEGPDFLGAHIQIGALQWFGHIEIDTHPEKWYEHRHHESPSYRNVVLHVVWDNRSHKVTIDCEGRNIPIVVLRPAVSASYVENLRPQPSPFPCAPIARLASEALWIELYTRWGEKRLLARHATYRTQEELFQAFWEALAYSFGVPQGEPFRAVAQACPLPRFQRYAETLLDKEALLLGIAGLLEGVSAPVDPYEEALLTRWHYLHKKHSWPILTLRWRSSRPVASPWIRLAAFATLMDAYPRPTLLLENLPSGLPLPSPYWQTHWAWQKKLPVPLRKYPPLLWHNVRINALYPFAIFYFKASGQIDRALSVIEGFQKLPPENNRFARMYAQWAYPAHNAWQTQGQLHLWRESCQPQRCLLCPIGQYLRRL
ncbi:MAG: DUF2851 family protein [Bacteroidia bacterium]|nr:DUF2851 family protein [Bacteroidia bacterium]GIV23222.1 MAG: hypothetical protein KatS3mg025_0881 [Bacteroidia bacterium]